MTASHPTWHNVHGKGKGGVCAKYCTMGIGKRKEHFSGHMLSVRTNYFGIKMLWCDACVYPASLVPVSHWRSWITLSFVPGCRSTALLPLACRKEALTSLKSTANGCLRCRGQYFTRRRPTAIRRCFSMSGPTNMECLFLQMVVHVRGRLKFFVSVAFLEGKGPQWGVVHKQRQDSLPHFARGVS